MDKHLPLPLQLLCLLLLVHLGCAARVTAACFLWDVLACTNPKPPAARRALAGTVAGNLTAVFQGRYLDTLGLPHGSGNVSQSAPWFKCFNQTCKALLR